MTDPAAARAALHRAIPRLSDEGAIKLARFLELGTEEQLAEKLGAHHDYEGRGLHPLTPTTAAQWLDGLALALWRKLGGPKP